MSKHSSVIIFTSLYILGIIAFLSNYPVLFSLFIVFLASYLLFFNPLIKIKYVFIFALAFILGIFNTALNIKYDDKLASFSDSDISAEAKVLTIPTNNIKDRTKFYAEIKKANQGEKKLEANGIKILVTINDLNEKISKIKIGDTVKLQGRLKLPQYSQNPSQFDYAKYLRYKKTFSLIYTEDKWEIISRADNLTGKILSGLNDTREKILKIHAKNIKSPMLEILGGIIFGDDAVNPDEEIKTSFINSGIFHILAASGMNVTLIFGIWFFIAIRLKLNYKFSIITGIFLILFYTFMTGFGPPIIRAALMLTLILTGKLIDRETHTISLLFAVCFIMLAFNPLMLFDVGFQLSFLVTFALILTAPLIDFKFKYKWINTALGACLIPVIAQIYAAPLQLYYFNTFTLYSVFANIAIIPVLSIVSFAGFVSSIIALVPAIAEKVCYFADLMLNPLLIYIVKAADFFSNLPYSILFLNKPLFIQVHLYYIIVTGIIGIILYKISNKKVLRIFYIMLLIFCLTFIKIPDKNPEILYFSTGNADSFLIKSPVNDYIMVDTAKNGYKGSPSAAKNIMIKYMRDYGIKDLSALILSHFDSDHAGGTVDILKDINVKKLYITDVYEDTAISESILSYTKENKISEEIITDTKEIYDKNGFKITLLKPKSNFIKNENQKSLIVHISYNKQNFLFMGDGDINSYNALPQKYKKDVSVIKSGHHGAKYTVNKEMTDNSRIFILSTGHNAYNHPHIETIKIITENNRHYLRTDRNNAIRVKIKPKKLLIQQYSPKYKKFENIEI